MSREPKTVGKTASVGFQAGARKTLDVPAVLLWSLVLGSTGQRLLFGKQALSADSRGVTTFVEGSHYRRKVAGGVLQVRVLPASNDRATLALHMEQLADAEARERTLERFQSALASFAALVTKREG